MRKSGLCVGMVIFVATAGLAFAQTSEGPLAPSQVAKPAKKTKHKKIAHRQTSHAAGSAPTESASSRRDLSMPGSGTAADPLSFGMKWNGNSDNARETRVQNYNAGASGSGAEVGMKLHF